MFRRGSHFSKIQIISSLVFSVGLLPVADAVKTWHEVQSPCDVRLITLPLDISARMSPCTLLILGQSIL